MVRFVCKNHNDRPAIYQCSRCSKPLCEECYNAKTDTCLVNCDADADQIKLYNHIESDQQNSGKKSVFWQVVVSLLAILGGITLLLLTICGAMIWGM